MAKTCSKHKKELYTAYKTSKRFETNRKRKLLKLLKQHPNNEQLTAALQNIHYRRKKPKSRQFSKTKISTLSLSKEARKIREAPLPKVHVKDMFSLLTRAHYKGVPFSCMNF